MAIPTMLLLHRHSTRYPWRRKFVCSKCGISRRRPSVEADVSNNMMSRTPQRPLSSYASRPLLAEHNTMLPSMVLYDSLSESLKEIRMSTDAHNGSKKKALAWYTCGPTTYAPAHLGHARTYVCLDIVRRVLEHGSTIPPLYVMNITDVDDKILAAARESNDDPTRLARKYENEFWEDLDRLGCLRPHVVTRVTEHVDKAIVPYIERIVEQGMAYSIDDEGVYFDVRAYEVKMGAVTKYGKLAPLSAASDCFSNHHSDDETSASAKRDPRDFVLWKLRKPDEPLFWPSPWGDGRPGWHIECSAMIQDVQREFKETHQFMVHAGGVDLKFPHHTNEIAQAEAYHGGAATAAEWIPHWVHTGHLHIQGMKMSKSLKNFITIREMLEEGETGSSLSSPADDFRLWCLGLSGSYRGPATYSKERIEEARIIREQLVQFLTDSSLWLEKSGDAAVRRWRDREHQLFQAVTEARANCLEALTQSDMDGHACVREIVRIATIGSAFLRTTTPDSAPSEPIHTAVQTLRDLLSLVGFSDATVRAGLDHAGGPGKSSSRIAGGESRLAEEFARFRAEIRRAALMDVRETSATSNVSDILALCDDVRERILPSIGLELTDGKGEEDDGASTWRFCIPHEGSPDMDKTLERKASRQDFLSVEDASVENLFRVGQYEDVFSEFDEDGMPIRNADGSEVSNRLRKKLLKKRDKHIKKLAKRNSSNS